MVTNAHDCLKDRLLLRCRQRLPHLVGSGRHLRLVVYRFHFHLHTPFQPVLGRAQRLG